MKDGQVEKHEIEVYCALYKYFNKILTDSGCLGTVLELGKKVGEDVDEYNKWAFDWAQDDSSGGFIFTHENTEVYASPYYEYSEGVSYAIYKDGELLSDGNLPIVVTGNSQVDVETYIGLVDDLIEKI